jgi:HK97 gp10 family phage protein
MLMPDDFLERLSKLGKKTDEISKEVLKAGGEVALQKVKSNLDAVIGHGLAHDSRSTGQLQEALGLSPPSLDRNGNYNIKVGFAENRTDGESNAKIANIIEFGKTGQQARPFLARAKRQSKKLCEAAMIKKFEEEVKKL